MHRVRPTVRPRHPSSTHPISPLAPRANATALASPGVPAALFKPPSSSRRPHQRPRAPSLAPLSSRCTLPDRGRRVAPATRPLPSRVVKLHTARSSFPRTARGIAHVATITPSSRATTRTANELENRSRGHPRARAHGRARHRRGRRRRRAHRFDARARLDLVCVHRLRGRAPRSLRDRSTRR